MNKSENGACLVENLSHIGGSICLHRYRRRQIEMLSQADDGKITIWIGNRRMFKRKKLEELLEQSASV